MADLLSMSPEATYASKGNIVPQKAYTAARTLTVMADGPGGVFAESTVEDHLPAGVGIVDASMTILGEGLVATSGV